MSERDSLNRAILGGEDGRPTSHAEHSPVRNLLRKSKPLLKYCCRASPLGWLILFSLVLTVISAFLAWRESSEQGSQYTPANLPESAAEMAMFLRDKLPRTRIVSTRTDGAIDRNFLLTLRDVDEDTLRSLPRISDRAAEWRGTVLCEWLVDREAAVVFIEQWEEYAFERPPFVFFGDKKLLAQIKEVLR
jgi:hypothetical protein